MRFEPLPLVALASAASAAVSASNSTTNGTTTIDEPCGVISSAVAEFYSNDSNAELNFEFLPSVANACLLSSGIDNELAADFVIEYKKYVEFLTTQAYLKDPPSDYPYPAVDILGGLDSLASKAAAGGFKSQYLLDIALNDLITSAHEGHLYTSFCSLQAISYQRPFNLASVSSDGVELPKLYLLADILNNSTQISDVVAINGQNATEVVEKEGLFQLMDPDAAYNYMTASQGRVPGSGSNIGTFEAVRYNFFPGDYTNVTFSNGTTVPFENFAYIPPGTWDTEIANGDDFTKAFCILPAQPSPTTSSASSSTATATSSSAATASATETTYPDLFPYTPVVRDPNNQVAGYFLNGSDYEDTAVLWVSSFAQEDPRFADPETITISFQNATRDFFAALRDAPSRTKLIIDLSGNGGGNTLLPDDLFKRLFPDIEPYGASRIRVPVAADIIGQTIAAVPDSLVVPTAEEIADPSTVSAQKIALYTSFFNYRQQLTTELTNFTGWSGKDGLFPPNVQKGDNFTANYRPPLNDTVWDESVDGLDVYGYPGANSETFPQPFPAENIVILTDGFCASACSIFAELLTRQAGIKTVVVGGRPQNAPMQAIGGTKGSLAQPFAQIQQLSQAVYNASEYIPSSLLELANSTLPGLNPLPLGANSATALKSWSVNGADNIPRGDDLQIPLQFVFEPANCRIFYSESTVLSPRDLWMQVADIAWKEGKCAWGGIDTVVGNNGTGVGNSTQTVPTSGSSSNSVVVSLAVLAAAVVSMLML
ncbi:uncharacterized protein PAC_12834 [Phialocephala subalpina]|uniref:CPAF-like PDZ domain-containing protein n=1 Tax=Phialocephala subalpina TaxID=576137 RepID=A0A1L7XDA2_9HELO|nr:uncharacterized protein PAC_12834 [Phialocephala subalpina]